MRRKKNSEISRDIGLEIGWICGSYFLKMDHLHYGYWTKDLPVDIVNLHAAQENYVKFLTSHIPEGVKTILDVGCGTGQLSKDLQSMGYSVDCISPNAFFAERTRLLLGNASRVYECKYQDFVTPDTYDLVFFSESFQYIGAEDGIAKSNSLLRDGGHLMICDFFRRPVLDKCALSGGERWTRFNETMEQYPFVQVADIDITDATAPTVDLLNDALQQAIQPTMALAVQLVASRHPLLHKLVHRIYRRKIEKINSKYFSGRMSGEDFKKCKSYRLLLYRKGQAAGPEAVKQTASNQGVCV
ncbi:MAG: class I SAM-dependent methyltransferase [Phycisphaerae bacterium]|nr:class I SAM-dependent methyltransferase [Phycisphaerae bacterium]